MSIINIEFDESTKAFVNSLRNSRGEFKRELTLFLEGLGVEFLRIVEDEIIRREVLDTRLLLASFHKGEDNNVWDITDGGLTLEVGTNVNYASYVNDGHWTNTKGVEQRWVPGYWVGDRFIYDPKAKDGMLIKQHWIDGKHYWDSALRIIDKIYPEFLEAKLQEWIDKYFGE